MPEAIALGQAELSVDNCGLVGIAAIDGDHLRAIALLGSQHNVYAIIGFSYLHSCDLSRSCRDWCLSDQCDRHAAQKSST